SDALAHRLSQSAAVNRRVKGAPDGEVGEAILDRGEFGAGLGPQPAQALSYLSSDLIAGALPTVADLGGRFEVDAGWDNDVNTAGQDIGHHRVAVLDVADDDGVQGRT